LASPLDRLQTHVAVDLAKEFRDYTAARRQNDQQVIKSRSFRRYPSQKSSYDSSSVNTFQSTGMDLMGPLLTMGTEKAYKAPHIVFGPKQHKLFSQLPAQYQQTPISRKFHADFEEVNQIPNAVKNRTESGSGVGLFP